MSGFYHQVTFRGPYAEYTVDALVDPRATFSVVPAAALIEMGIEPARTVRLDEGGETRFRKLGRVLTIVDGVEDMTPVLFGDAGRPAVLGGTSLAILLLEADVEAQTIGPFHAWSPSLVYEGDIEALESRGAGGTGVSWKERISKVPAVQGGRPVIKGTRAARLRPRGESRGRRFNCGRL